MKESPLFESTHKKEKIERDENESKFISLEGFEKMNKKQRQYILMSLYVQQRAERKTDPLNAERIQDLPDKFAKNSPGGVYITHADQIDGGSTSLISGDIYRKSQLFIMNENCHYSVDELEKYSFDILQKEWQDAGPINSYDDLVQFIYLIKEQSDFPFVVEIRGRKYSSFYSGRVHTSVVLGENEEGDFLMWEKAGYGMSFQIITLREVYEAYKDCKEWRLRKLAV